MKENFTHIAYSDESSYTNKRFSSISMISLKLKNLEELTIKINDCLKSSDIKEFKWNSTGSAKYRFCAIKIIDIVFEFAKKGLIRVDTIIWDSSKRKEFLPENDITILSKMYHHLFNNVLTMRWPKSNWKLFPDRQSAIDWNEFLKILENVSSKLKFVNTVSGNIIIDKKSNYEVIEICEIDSKESYLCQITDLFSGLAAFYHLECPHCNIGPNQSLLIETNKAMSNTDRERYEIIKYLKEKSKQSSMEIIFDFYKGVKTLNPDNPINFWQFQLSPDKYNNQNLNKFF